MADEYFEKDLPPWRSWTTGARRRADLDEGRGAEGPRAEVFSAESIFTYSDQLWLLTGGAADN